MNKLLHGMILTASVFIGPSAAEAQHPPCAKEAAEMSAVRSEYEQQVEQFNQAPPEEEKSQACIGGTLTWEKATFKMDIPEFKMTRKSWKADIPETKLVDQILLIKEPIIRCENKKIVQYPETTCEDSWITIGSFKTKGIPKCTVFWSDVITKVCWPETHEKRIVISVPEFKMNTREFSWDIPEVALKTREFSLHLPHFHPESGCVGADCTNKCKAETETALANRDQDRASTLQPSQEKLVATTSSVFQCIVDDLNKQGSLSLSEFDKYMVVSEATLKIMREQGLTVAAEKQEKQLTTIRDERSRLQASLAELVAMTQATQKQAVQNLAGN